MTKFIEVTYRYEQKKYLINPLYIREIAIDTEDNKAILFFNDASTLPTQETYEEIKGLLGVNER